jgi:hypothetical protein
MTRYILALIVVVLQACAVHGAEAQLKPMEIGYIEDFDHSPDAYILKTGGTRREVAILAPIFNGDTIEVINPSATLTLRKVEQEGPVVLSKANDVATITAHIPEKGFWSGIFNWTASAVQLFDREQRDQVSASIRGDAGEKLPAPLFAQPQTVLAGRRKLVVGWLAPRAVEIRVVDGDGRPVVNGRGSGKLWATPEIDWNPGAYAIELAADGETLRQGFSSSRWTSRRLLRSRSPMRPCHSPCERSRSARGMQRTIRPSCSRRCSTWRQRRARRGLLGF